MKNTTYITEITTQKNEKYLSEGRNPLLACLPACLMSTKKFCMSLLKSVLPFNQAAWFISHGIGCSYFSRNFLLSFLLWYDFKILVKSRQGGTFLCLALSVNIQQMYHFLTER